jgi:hypothetical protein
MWRIEEMARLAWQEAREGSGAGSGAGGNSSSRVWRSNKSQPGTAAAAADTFSTEIKGSQQRSDRVDSSSATAENSNESGNFSARAATGSTTGSSAESPKVTPTELGKNAVIAAWDFMVLNVERPEVKQRGKGKQAHLQLKDF